MANTKDTTAKPAPVKDAEPVKAEVKSHAAVLVANPNKIFSTVEPKQSDRAHARQFAVGDEWHNDEVVSVWDGKAWAKKK